MARTFKVVVHGDTTSGYWAEVPELPGCYSQGDSIPELEANVREAISLSLEESADPQVALENISIVEVTV
jgi:predicted RNase H-like HicB family nuclease